MINCFSQIVEKIKQEIYVQKRFPENRVICELMWKNMVEPETTQ
jgi:hypothetical protein